MLAFVLSFAIALAGTFGAVLWYGKRRPVGAPLSWGAAIVAATYTYALMFWAYGVVPHQWLTWAGNELGWRTDAIVAEEGKWEVLGIPIPPFVITKENISHMIVVGIYGFFLTLHVWAFMTWQNRSKVKVVELPTSEYGRPLVRQG